MFERNVFMPPRFYERPTDKAKGKISQFYKIIKVFFHSGMRCGFLIRFVYVKTFILLQNVYGLLDCNC